MNNEFSIIIKSLKYLFIALLVEFLVVFIFFTAKYSSYDKNLFEVKLNGTLMNCYYTEKYTNGFLINAGSGGYNDVESRLNKVDLNSNMNLEIHEYEIYYKNNHRKQDSNGWHRENDLIYKEIKNSKLKLKIVRMNKVIYDGEYISNISKYINENGRYYIHVYVERTDGLLSNVNTHISFNVIVGGGNLEEKN